MNDDRIKRLVKGLVVAAEEEDTQIGGILWAQYRQLCQAAYSDKEMINFYGVLYPREELQHLLDEALQNPSLRFSGGAGYSLGRMFGYLDICKREAQI